MNKHLGQLLLEAFVTGVNDAGRALAKYDFIPHIKRQVEKLRQSQQQ